MLAKKRKTILHRLLTTAVVSAVIAVCSADAFSREDDVLAAKKATCASRFNKYNVLVLEHNPPFSWVKQTAQDGEATSFGIGVYILDELLQDANIVGNMRKTKATMTRDDLEYQTWRKPVDTAVGIQYYPSLSSDIQDRFLHPAYMTNPIVAVFAKGKEKELNNSSDLDGMSGAIIKSDHIDYLFPKEMYLTSVDSVKDAFEKLLTGKIDYVLMGFYTAEMETEKFKIKDKVVISQKVLRRVNNFLTLNRERPCGILAEDFDAKIKEITNNKEKMQNLLYRAYQDYAEQTKMFPPLKIEEPEPEEDEEF